MAETKNTLVIVESPAKAKTIGKFLGGKYRVVASNGHVRDLPKSQLGVDTAHAFEPKYITLRGRGTCWNASRRKRRKPIASFSRRTLTAKAKRSRGISRRS